MLMIMGDGARRGGLPVSRYYDYDYDYHYHS